MSNRRNSSIELLRIIAMLMIILGHLAGHGVLQMAQENVGSLWIGGGLLNKLFSIFLLPGGRIGVGIFFLITGYFQIEKNDAKILKVVSVTLFYGFFIGIVGIIVGGISLGSIVRGLMPLSTSTWWYVSTYIVLMIASPWINGKFNQLNRSKKIITLILCWLLAYLLPYILSATYYSITRCLLFYLLGAYIKTEIDVLSLSKHKILFSAICVISWLAYIPCGYYFYQYQLNKTITGIIVDGCIYNGLIVPICSTSIFCIFVCLKEFNNTAINKIASTTFGIYLLHDNYLRSWLWNLVIKVPQLYQNPLFPLLALIMVMLIFVACGLIDAIRNIFFEVIKRRRIFFIWD